MPRIKNIALYCLTFLALILISACEEEHKKTSEKLSPPQQVINVYTSRLPELVTPIFDAFTQKTNIRVNYIFLKKGILERLKSEAEFTPADLILVSDIGAIYDIVNTGLVSPIQSTIIKKNIPAQYRSKKQFWTGLTGRVRMLARTTNDLPIEINGYDALADIQLKGKICSRSFTHPYNVSLIAGYLHQNGPEKTQKWVQKFYDNLFDKPSGNDRGQMELISTGLCDLAPVNHYYYERMLKSNPDLTNTVKLVPLKNMQNGAYANVSGIMLSKFSQNQENAQKLVEFMTSETAQEIFAKYDLEYPLNPKVASTSNVFQQGSENIASIPLDDIAEKRKEALKIIYSIKK